MDGLSPETRDLLARAEGGDAMPDERRRVLRARIAGALGVAAPLAAASAPATSPGAYAAARWARWARRGHVGHWAGGATPLGTLGLAGALAGVVAAVVVATRPVAAPGRKMQPSSVHAVPAVVATNAPPETALTEEPLAASSVVVSPTTAPVVPAAHSDRAAQRVQIPRAGPAPTAPASPVPTAPASPVPAAPASPVPAAPAPALPPPSDLGTEAHLLTSAQTALAYGNPSQALVFLDEHDARFPAGTLTPESGSLRVSALCASGRVQEARAEATRLRARFPSALAASGAGASCAAP
jgi:hypothetical protein